MKAYAAVIYLRIIKKTEVTIILITSKTRVAPVKTVLIPRLKLCGAQLLAKLLSNVMKILNLDSAEYFLWTDSMVAETTKPLDYVCHQPSG